MKSKRVTFTRDEQSIILALVKSLDPDRYFDVEAKAVIYKMKVLNDGDTVVWQRR